jgi:hypothetical protein
MTPGAIPTDRLCPDDLPDLSEGWGLAAVEFAHTFDGYAYLGGVSPEELGTRLVTPLRDALRRAGRVPHAYTIDDLRAVVFWLARADRFSDWSQGRPGDNFHLYFAVMDRIRYLLVRRVADGHSTPAGTRHRCPWCGSRAVARVLYGMPAYDADLERKIESGELTLGGCVVNGEQPEMHCNACGHEYRHDWRPGVPLVDDSAARWNSAGGSDR